MASGDEQWYYLDSTGQEFGPFPSDTMREWFSQGFFPIGAELPVRTPAWSRHVPLRLAYPDVSRAFVGPAAISDPDDQSAAPPAAALAPPPFNADQFGGGYYMMPGAGMMMPGMMPGMQQGGMGKGGMGVPSYGGGMMPGMMQGMPSGRMCGRIKSFNAKQGFGFIECPEAHAMFGRDIFLHKAQIGDMKVGTEVTFGVESNKQGMPQARDLLTLDGKAPGPGPIDMGGPGQQQGGNGGGGRGKGGGKGKGGNRRNKGDGNQQGPGGGASMMGAPMMGQPMMGQPMMGAPQMGAPQMPE